MVRSTGRNTGGLPAIDETDAAERRGAGWSREPGRPPSALRPATVDPEVDRSRRQPISGQNDRVGTGARAATTLGAGCAFVLLLSPALLPGTDVVVPSVLPLGFF